MKIIIDNETLLALVPNTISTVEGERDLYSKIRNWLMDAEQWVMDTLTGEDVLDTIAEPTTTAVWNTTANLIVSRALMNAVPSLDLVLTPNGFGIVSNSNVAPASKERVERLLESLQRRCDAMVTRLLAHLTRFENWKSTNQYKWLSETLLCNPEHNVLAVYGRKYQGSQWDNFLALRGYAKLIEDALSEKWFGYEQMQIFRNEAALQFTGENKSVIHVAYMVEQAVIYELRNRRRDRWQLDRIIDYMRKHEADFEAWTSSPQYELFNNPPVFTNEKKSQGYFF